MADPTAIDRAELDERIAYINTMTELHMGSVELVSAIDGVVTIRFQGLCTACHLRPVTLNALVRPALADIPGVRQVQATGIRVSAYAEQRMAGLRENRNAVGAQYERLTSGFATGETRHGGAQGEQPCATAN